MKMFDLHQTWEAIQMQYWERRLNGQTCSFSTMLDENVWSVSRGLLILLGLAGYLKQWSPISAKIYSDICPWTLSVPRGEQLVNLQRFYDALFASIYRDFTMPRLRQFTEISWCPVCVNLQRFYDAPFASICRDFMMPRLRQFIEILWCPVNYRHFI